MRETASTRLRSRFGLTQWIRLVVSAALIIWIGWKVDWADFGRTIRGTDPVFLGLSFVVDIALLWISAWKWQILLRARSEAPGIASCCHLYLIGYFFNNFLPTNVGGDVVRGYLLGQRTGRTAEAMASVFVERFTGVTALIVVALIAIPFGFDELYAGPVGLAVGAVVVAYLLLLWAILDRRFLRFTRGRPQLPFVEKIVRFQEAIHLYGGHRKAVVICLALSLLFYVGAALNIYLSAKTFRADLHFHEALLVTPVVLIIAMLPISIGGLGLMEGAYLFALGQFGIAPAVSLSTALLLRTKNVVLGLFGGIGYGLSGGALLQPAPAAPAAERAPSE